MFSRQRAASFIYPLVLLMTAPGCLALARSRPVVVQAKDAETGQLIAGAEIRLAYPIGSAEDLTASTGKDGIAHIQVGRSGDNGFLLIASAKGYLLRERDLSSLTIQQIEPVHLFESVERRPPNVVVELYAEPRPRVELVVPIGYHGLVKVEIQVEEAVPHPPGQRVFTGQVSPSGTVHVVGSPVLDGLYVTDYSAHLADGTPLPTEADGPAVGFWWLRTEAKTQCFWIGTRAEFDALVPSTQRGGGNRNPGNGQGGGGGRHGHRGNSSGS